MLNSFPIRQDIEVLPCDDPAQIRLGWVVYEELGCCVINNYALTSVEIEDTLVSKMRRIAQEKMEIEELLGKSSECISAG